MKIHIGPYKNYNRKTKKTPPRKISVKIDNYDVWGMDSTLAYIIVPMLKLLKKKKQGAPYVDDIDVPMCLKSTSAKPKKNEWDTDSLHFKRWDWVMGEMIWAFDQVNKDWEDKFYKGKYDLISKPIPGTDLSELVEGPKHTLKCDTEGMKKHQKRMSHGFMLFGKYYQSLWD